MAAFPEREADIARLAHDIASGLAAHPDDFPAPPVGAEEIQQSIAEYNASIPFLSTHSVCHVGFCRWG